MQDEQQFSVEDAPASQAAEEQTQTGSESTESQTDQNQNQDAPDLGADGQQAEAAEETAAPAFPEKLTPFQKLLESRKWDHNNPDLLPTVLQSYSELESMHGKTQTERKHTESRAEVYTSLLRGDVDAINKFREKEGLQPITKAPSLDDRVKETETLITNFNEVLTGGPNKDAAYKALNDHFSRVQGDLEFEKRYNEKNPTKSATDTFNQRKADGQSRFANFVAKNPETKDHLDALTPHLSPGGLLYGMGVDLMDVVSSDERFEGFLEIGKALTLSKNFEKAVADGVKAELERRRTASQRGDSGKTHKTSHIKADAFDPLGLFVK
jgi:hypothetical protein